MYVCIYIWASLVAQIVKNMPAMQETGARSLGRDLQDNVKIRSHIFHIYRRNNILKVLKKKKNKVAGIQESLTLPSYKTYYKVILAEPSLMVQWLTLCFQARGAGSIPGWGTKIPHATGQWKPSGCNEDPTQPKNGINRYITLASHQLTNSPP